MVQVVLDTHILIWGGIRKLRGDQQQRPKMVERAKWLLAQLQREKAQIVIPAIVAAELAIPIPARRRGDFLTTLAASFILRPFDLHAAAIAADLHARVAEAAQKELPARPVLSADVKIIATAKAAGAGIFYSSDAKCRRVAQLVMEARDLPTHAEELFN